MESNNEYTVSFVDLGLSKKNNNIRGVYHAGNHKNNLEKIKKVTSIKSKAFSLKLPFLRIFLSSTVFQLIYLIEVTFLLIKIVTGPTAL